MVLHSYKDNLFSFSLLRKEWNYYYPEVMITITVTGSISKREGPLVDHIRPDFLRSDPTSEQHPKRNIKKLLRTKNRSEVFPRTKKNDVPVTDTRVFQFRSHLP